MATFVTWDVSSDTDLMTSIMQANLRSAFENLSKTKEPDESSIKD